MYMYVHFCHQNFEVSCMCTYFIIGGKIRHAKLFEICYLWIKSKLMLSMWSYRILLFKAWLVYASTSSIILLMAIT